MEFLKSHAVIKGYILLSKPTCCTENKQPIKLHNYATENIAESVNFLFCNLSELSHLQLETKSYLVFNPVFEICVIFQIFLTKIWVWFELGSIHLLESPYLWNYYNIRGLCFRPVQICSTIRVSIPYENRTFLANRVSQKVLFFNFAFFWTRTVKWCKEKIHHKKFQIHRPINKKIPSEIEVAPRYNCWNCRHCWHC